MPSIGTMLASAVERHQAGRLAEAEAIYRQILIRNPQHADSLHLLGLLASEAGNHEAAAACIGHAIRIKPTAAVYYRNLGLALHRGRRYQEAIVSYCKALELEPSSGETIFKMSRSMAALGFLEDAIGGFGQALRLLPDFADAHFELGLALAALGRFEEAEAAYREVLRREPADPEARYQLGNALQLLGRREEALAAYRESLRLRPGHAETHYQVGNTLHFQERFEQAETAYRRALEFKPGHAEAHYNLGVTLTRLNRAEQAVLAYQQALVHKPDYPEAHSNLANLRQAQGRLEEAEAGYREALRLKPDYLEARYNLGVALQDQDRLQEALAAYDEILRLEDDHVDARNNRAGTLLALGQVEQAMAGYEETLRRQPHHEEANWNRALVQLQSGDFEPGWEGYEWRLRQKNAETRVFSQPPWDGSSLDGRTVLIPAEQGLGDTIQFIRYLEQVRQKSGRIVVECQARLLPLLRNMRAIDDLVAKGSALPDFDCHLPLMSLPRIFKTTLATVPARVPYLGVDAERVALWRRRIGRDDLLKVGLVWGGNPSFKNERRRCIPLEKLIALLRIPNAAFFSLQRGPQSRELESVSGELPIEKLEEEGNEITDTAAIVQNLDLVITVDTMLAHLAGALARPVWVLLSFAADWRWLLQRSDSPWYPTMRLFRQPAYGDWDSVIDEVRQQLLCVPAPR